MRSFSAKDSANYDFSQEKPEKRMGEGFFANLPSEPIFGKFGPPKYRDGLINSFTSSVDELSGMDENER